MSQTQHKSIELEGVRVHNLKNVDLCLPLNRLTVISGVSGSGKSSLAFDTLYAEGQRRYIECFSAYARQFLDRLEKPDAERIENIPPAIAIRQSSVRLSSKSTVATTTEIHDYLRLLYARIGIPHCPQCGREVKRQTIDQIVERVLKLPTGEKIVLLAPVIRDQKGEHKNILEKIRKTGYVRVRFDGDLYSMEEAIDMNVDKNKKHNLEVVVDRLVVGAPLAKTERSRLFESIETALDLGNGLLIIHQLDKGNDLLFSQHFSCDACGSSYDELTPHHFSFNSRMGWCPNCEGLGIQHGTNPDSVAIRPGQSIVEGAIAGWEAAERQPLLRAMLTALAEAIGFDVAASYETLTEAQRHALLFGLGDRWIPIEDPIARGMRFQWKGVIPAIHEATKNSWRYRTQLEHLVSDVPC